MTDPVPRSAWLPGRRSRQVEYRRGFPEAVTLRADRYVAAHAALHAAAPIARVTLTFDMTVPGYETAVANVFACPTVARLDMLEFKDPWLFDADPNGAVALLPLPGVPVAVAVTATRGFLSYAARVELTCDCSPGRSIRVAFAYSDSEIGGDVPASTAELLARIDTDRLAAVVVTDGRGRLADWVDVAARLPPTTRLTVNRDTVPPARAAAAV